MNFNIRNMDSLDVRDAKMPAELVKAFYDLSIQSILDIGCGSGWVCDYMPPKTRYLGFDQDPRAIANARVLHPEGIFLEMTIEQFAAVHASNVRGVPESDFILAKNYFDCAFLKCIFCVIPKELVPKIVDIIKAHVTKYVILYDTEREPLFWAEPFRAAGFTLEFSHLRQNSHVQVWSVNK